jgi:hypothetical protein
MTTDDDKTKAKSPTVDYVPTAPGSFCPPPGWKAPPMPETWPARMARLNKKERKAV